MGFLFVCFLFFALLLFLRGKQKGRRIDLKEKGSECDQGALNNNNKIKLKKNNNKSKNKKKNLNLT